MGCQLANPRSAMTRILTVSLLLLSLHAFAGWTKVGDADVTFIGIGPAGFKLEGKTQSLEVKDDGKSIATSPSSIDSTGAALVHDIGLMITSARHRVAHAANAALTTLYWQIGTRVRQDVLRERRAEYGAQIVAALQRQLGWTHFKVLLPLKEPLKREFYAEMCRAEGWSTRVLAQKIDVTTDLVFQDRDRSASRSTVTTTTSTCCSSIVGCGGWWSSS